MIWKKNYILKYCYYSNLVLYGFIFIFEKREEKKIEKSRMEKNVWIM